MVVGEETEGLDPTRRWCVGRVKPANRLLARGNQRLLDGPWSELILGVSTMEVRCELRGGAGKVIGRHWGKLVALASSLLLFCCFFFF